MKIFLPALLLISPLVCGLYLTRDFWLEPEILAMYWVEPFLFGLVTGSVLAAAVFAMSRRNQQPSSGDPS